MTDCRKGEEVGKSRWVSFSLQIDFWGTEILGLLLLYYHFNVPLAIWYIPVSLNSLNFGIDEQLDCVLKVTPYTLLTNP